MNTGKTLYYGYAYMYTCLRRKGLRLEHGPHRTVVSRATRRSYSYTGVLFELVWNVSRLPIFFRAFESDYHDWIGEPYVFVIPLCRCRHYCRCSEWPYGDSGRGRNIHTQRYNLVSYGRGMLIGMWILAGTVNSMVDRLSTFASEVTRVALEIGQGILGGQARVEGV